MLPVIPVVLPLFAAAMLAATTRIISQRLSKGIAASVTLCTLANLLYLLRASASQPIVYWFGGWRPRGGSAIGISFVIDPFGAGLAAFAALLTLAALTFSSKYFDTVGNHFHALLLAFLAAMCGFTLTGDLFNMFVFFELMSAAAFALCGYKSDDPGSLQGAFNFAVTNTVAAYFVLTGIAVLYARTGALNMAQMGRALQVHAADSLVIVGFVFLVCGYLVKAAVVPFHFWLADAHAVAPSPVCILFSGVMVEMGLYALARIYWATFHTALGQHQHGLTTLFVTIGSITAIVGALMCYLQSNVKRLLAFSTVSHIGLMTVGVGLFSQTGLAGAGIYSLGHGMVKAALFLVAGILLHRFESVDEMDLHGKGRGLWWTAAVFFAGAFGLAGLPGSGLASGSDLMRYSATAADFHSIFWVFLFASILTAAAVLRVGGRVFFGWGHRQASKAGPKQEEKPETQAGHQHTPYTMFVPAAVLVLSGLFLGLVPGLRMAANRSALQFENTDAYGAHVLYGRPFQVSLISPQVASHPLEGFAAVMAAIAIALIDLFGPRDRRAPWIYARPIHFLHRLHSGHVGDYMAFLTFGFALIGLLCAYCFR